MLRLRFLADMNLSPITVLALRQAGFDIIRVSALLPAGATDQEILSTARQHGMTVVTHDLDFSALLALGNYSNPSLLTLRLSNTDPDAVTRRLVQVLPKVESALQKGSAVTIDDSSIRIRSLPI